MSVARSSARTAGPAGLDVGVGDVRAASFSASTAGADPSICQTCARSGSEEVTESRVARCSSVSTITPRAPEFDRHHSYCEAEDVS